MASLAALTVPPELDDDVVLELELFLLLPHAATASASAMSSTKPAIGLLYLKFPPNSKRSPQGPSLPERTGIRGILIGDVAYDEDLANRIRELVGAEQGVDEKKMFGGLAFLIGGNMSVAASGQGGLLVRCDPELTDELLEKPGVRPMVMRGREMQGWLRVDADAVRTKRQLEPWVKRGVGYARSLPKKT